MFILLTALLLGLTAGYLTGGRLRNLEHLSLRLPWLALVALALQLVAFTRLGAPLDEGGVVALHLASYGALVVFVLVNLRETGVVVTGIGMLLNLLVIILNGGYMPASRAALAAAGGSYAGQAFNNSEVIGPGTRLGFLADVFAVPEWLPVSNVFSIGDVIIVVGVVYLIAASMRDVPGQVAEAR
jgi:hypothetical protein